ncbi:hypothetical protein J7K60_05175 [Candidatus Bipolaricaulota bacterium]|nr:hypothetical protein [Candidatus Bipolaricaulota bacterium]
MVKKAVIVGLLLVVILASVALGREIVVTSIADSRTGSFRWALQAARSGDTITFDPQIFPPDHPATIYPRSELPQIHCGNLTIDASNAGVIIDGSNVPSDWNNGLQVYSDRNTVMGMQIVNFAGSGIVVGGGKRNTIGGDRTVGSRPIGQGNLVCGNGIGINLCDVGTYANAVLGNLIGVAADGTTPWGNRDFGVFVENNVHDNVIGPGNVIANNGQGILIIGATAFRNRITQNSIHTNRISGISLQEGANSDLHAPTILDFALEEGAVSGVTCHECQVELFSDHEYEGAIYEGHTQADKSGQFSFSSTGPLKGPNLTATTSDPQGNTSSFSSPTQGTRAARILQTGNDTPKQLLITNSSSELADNRMGGMWNGFWQLDNQASWTDIFTRQILGLGLTRAALTINSREQITAGQQAADMSQPEMSILPVHDALFTMVSDWGVQITYTLTFWDKENPHTADVLSGPRFQTEEEIARYLEFVQFIVSHFKDRVQRYEVWGEPDLGAPGHHIPLLTYIDLVPRLVSVVHTADPEAKIQVGATSGLRDRESQDYLFAVLQSEIMPLVDVVAWHPFYGESPIHEASYYYEYPSIVRQIKRTAEANGFVGEYQADEMVWWTHGEVNDQPWRYSTLQSAKYTARTVLLHLGMDVSATLGGIGERPDIFTTIQNLCTTMAGHEAIDMLVEIDINYNGPVAHCSFRFPNGDRMLAVWTDGIAQDEDPGVPATITFPGLTARTVTGIDVLRGFEQDLVFKTDGDSTIVRDLLVKDYPILIKLSDVTMNPDYAETVGDGFHRLGNVNAMPSSTGSSSDRDGDGVPDDEDYCPDWPGSKEANGC